MSIKLRLVRACLIEGIRVEVGAVVKLSPAVAATLLDANKAELVDAADAAAVQAGRRAEVADLMRGIPRQAPPAGPWVPL